MDGRSIERLDAGRRPEVLEVLAAAFAEYPVMRYVLRDAGGAYPRQLEQLIGHLCDRRFTRGWPVLGLHAGGRLAAVATVSPPAAVPEPAALRASFERLREGIGEAAIARLQAFEAASDDNEPEEPHHFVGMLGVHPEHRGRGHARRLLDAVQALSRADPASRAVALSTEDPANVPFYLHVGFRIVGEADVGALHTWGFVRRDRVPPV